MKLGHIFQSYKVWNEISKLKISPTFAYKILKYLQKLTNEHMIIEQQRVQLIYDITKTEPGSYVEIKPDSDEYKRYVSEFANLLSLDSEVPKFDSTLDEFVTNLSGNTLSVQELALLEPFFNE